MKIIILFFFTHLFFAQSIGNKVEYFFLPANAEDIQNALKQDDPFELNRKINEARLKLKPVLIFNDTIGAFYIENLEHDVNIVGASILYLNTPNKLIVDSNKKLILQNNLPGYLEKEKYIITDSLITNWTLTNETKTIDSYLCYKATFVFNSTTKKDTITAWYCPELPFSFGPKGYGGLPGLIVELSDKRGVLGIKTLSLNVPIDDNVLEIKGDEMITRETYTQIINKLMNE